MNHTTDINNLPTIVSGTTFSVTPFEFGDTGDKRTGVAVEIATTIDDTLEIVRAAVFGKQADEVIANASAYTGRPVVAAGAWSYREYLRKDGTPGREPRFRSKAVAWQ